MAPSLLTAVDSAQHIHLIIGSSPIAAARCSRSMEAGATPILIAPKDSVMHHALHKRIDDGQLTWLQREFKDEDLSTLGRPEVEGFVDAVFVTLGPRQPASAHISNLCKRHRIPVNVADSPSLSTFTLLSTYVDGPLQIGITTSGRGCKLAARIRREIGASLPADIGSAVERLGMLRKRLQEEDRKQGQIPVEDPEMDDDDAGQSATFNQLVLENDQSHAKDRRLRWLSQICEYWPLKRLAAISAQDVDDILLSYRLSVETSDPPVQTEAPVQKKLGRIILAGSGPGSPELLTGATLTAINTADVILADKLVPSAVLDLIPRRTTVHIARKFPGNAEAAQEELMNLGIAGVQAGKTVLRLKQGDPYIFGRGGEEVIYFRERGVEAIVLPGLTSSLSAPLFAGIPVTQRAVADQVLICTGTGRAGKAMVPPEWVPTRTTIFLMALHRLPALVESLTGIDTTKSEATQAPVIEEQTTRWPITTPCAIIERASCRDQRVIRTTLQHVCAAVEELGSLPPGLLVVGNACSALVQLKGRWKVEEGYMDLSTLAGPSDIWGSAASDESKASGINHEIMKEMVAAKHYESGARSLGEVRVEG